MKRNRHLARYCKGFALLLGVVFTVLGLVILLKVPSIYDFVVTNTLEVTPGTKAFEAWRTNDPPLVLDFYFFNWTNAPDVFDASIRPKFEQVGPYRFGEVKEKYNITFHDNDTVSFQYVKRYFYLADESPRKLTDVIYSVNTVAASAAYKKRFGTFFEKFSLSMSLSLTSSVYIRKSIDELMFGGYIDPLLGLLKQVSPLLPEEVRINDHKFGWFYKRNNTYGISGTFSMHTGQDEHFGEMLSWDYKNETSFFAGGTCNEIIGSAGEFYPINRERDFIRVYSSELCTFAKLEYEKDIVVKDVKAYKYSADTLFDNGTRVPEYSCYCNGECLPSGVLNISSCRQEAPIFLSLPHFYNADPYYTDLIEGMSPSKDKHDFYIALEPKSAIAMEVAARMQLNVLLQPVPGITIFEYVPRRMFVPVFFFDQIVRLDDDVAKGVFILQNFPTIAEHTSYVFIVCGCLLIVSVIIGRFVGKARKPSENNVKVAIPTTTTTVELPSLTIKDT